MLGARELWQGSNYVWTVRIDQLIRTAKMDVPWTVVAGSIGIGQNKKLVS